MTYNSDPRFASVMGSITRMVVVILCAAALSQTAIAATGTWSGAASGTWNTSASNWSGVSGTPWDATNGSTNDAVFNTASLNATVSGTVYAKSIAFSTGGTLNYGTDGALSFGGSSTLSAAGGQKGSLLAKVLGSGTLTKSDGGTNYINGPAWGANTFNGAVVVNAGTLHINGGASGAASGRGLASASSFSVNAGATLLCEGDSPLNGTAPVIITGGSLIKKTGSAYYATLGALTLTNGTVLSARGAGASFQGFALNGAVTVGGTAASTIGTQGGADSGVHLFFNDSTDNNQRIFNVADATGNAASDLIVSAPLLDSSHTGKRSGLIKTGAGTLQLDAANTYSGTTSVSNGTLVIVGTIANSSNIVVSSGCQLIGHSFSGLNRPITLNSGAIIFWNNHCQVGPLTMNGGTLTTSDGVNSDWQSVILQSNVTAVGTSASYIYPGGTHDNGIHLADIGSGGTVIRTFDVADATASAAADLTVSAKLINGRGDLAVAGLAKKGAGTMVLSGVNAYTGRTVVEAGTLKLGTNTAVASSSALTINGGVLDLNGFSVTNAVLDGSVAGSDGVVSNGTLAVTTTVTPGGSNKVSSVTLPNAPDLAGTLWVDVSPSGGTCDQLKVTGNLSVSKLALQIVDANQLNKASEYTIAQCAGGTVTGAFLSDNLPYPWKVYYQADRIVLKVRRGTVIRFL